MNPWIRLLDKTPLFTYTGNLFRVCCLIFMFLPSHLESGFNNSYLMRLIVGERIYSRQYIKINYSDNSKINNLFSSQLILTPDIAFCIT